MQKVNCPKCNVPQFFSDGVPIPAVIPCINMGFGLYYSIESPIIPPGDPQYNPQGQICQVMLTATPPPALP